MNESSDMFNLSDYDRERTNKMKINQIFCFFCIIIFYLSRSVRTLRSPGDFSGKRAIGGW